MEAEFSTFFGGGSACAVSSGTAALFIALKGLGIGPGCQVGVPTYACSALLNAIYMAGASPLVADVRPTDFTLDPASLEAVSGGKSPEATILVHTYGVYADVPSIAAVGGAVLEDCCHSLGGYSNGYPIGIQGAGAVFSFYATKVITGGQGGLVYDRSGVLTKAALDYRDFDGRETFEPRFNLQMTDIQAAMVRSQFSRLTTIVERRRAIARRYFQVLPDGVGVQAGQELPECMPYRFVVTLPNAEVRDDLRLHLARCGIETIVPVEGFELLHRYLKLDPRHYPNAERLVDTTLSLPLYPSLSDAQVEAVCDALTSYRLAWRSLR